MAQAKVNLTPGLRVRTVIDQRSVLAMVGVAERSFPRAYKFAERFIVKAVREEVFTAFVQALAARSGGFPEIYTEHLIRVMASLPIKVQGGQQVYKQGGPGGYGGVSVEYSISSLGDFKDFEKGAHFNALLATGGEGNHPESSGLRNHGGKTGDRHHGINPHPARVTLPYGGQPLMNEKEAREKFWNEVIVNRNFAYELGLMRGKEHWKLQDHMERMGYEVSTLNEVYLARVVTWGDKAPQWLLLEFGSERLFGKSQPVIKPVNFYKSLNLVTTCIGSTIFEGVIASLVAQSEEIGSQLNVAGIPYDPITGQFAVYKDITDFYIPDYSHCFGSL